MSPRVHARTFHRRDLLLAAVGVGVGLTVSGKLSDVLAAKRSDDFKAAYKELVGAATPTKAKINLDIDAYIENGSMVFYRLSVDHPMRDDDYVKRVHLLSTENPFAKVATFHFTPQSGRAAIAGRMRLANTQTVVALAELSNGELYIAERYVQVAIGGCQT